MLVLYGTLGGFLLGVNAMPIPWCTILLSVFNMWANENCPIFPGNTRVLHVGFDDPPKFAQNAKNKEEALNCYRQVRDEIRDFINKLPKILEE